MPKPILEINDAHRIRIQFEAWMQGAVSRCKEIPLHENPYQERSLECDAWENGWETIDDQI